MEVLPGVKGMVHVSQLDTVRSNVEDYPEGMAIDVKVIDVSFCTPLLHAHSRVLGMVRILGGQQWSPGLGHANGIHLGCLRTQEAYAGFCWLPLHTFQSLGACALQLAMPCAACSLVVEQAYAIR